MKKSNNNKRNKKLTVYELTKCAMFVALLAICSWITVPSVIPFTMQTFAVFTMCAVLGTKLSVITVMVYIVLGAIGLPVFSGFRGGVGVLIGATGGYIWGFLLTALACGILIDLQKKCGKKSKIFTVLSMLVGLIVVPLVSLVTPKPKKEDTERIFSCYSAEVVVHAKSSLKEKE